VRVARLTSPLAFRSLGIRQRPRRFAPCQLDEGRRSPKTLVLRANHAKNRAATSRIPFCSPRAATEGRMRLPREDIASDPKPETWISCTASLLESPVPSPVREEFIMGRLVMAKDSQDRHVAGRTHAKRKRTWKTRRLMLFCTSARWGPNDTRTRRNDKRPSLHPISLFSRETAPFGAAGRWLPIAEVPRRPEASQELRRRATCR